MKYRNKSTKGYASKREASRAAQLHMLENCGHITNLREQVRFELIPRQPGERSCSYIADFVYNNGDTLVVEDVKGYRTQVYRIKRKLMLHVHGIRITEV